MGYVRYAYKSSSIKPIIAPQPVLGNAWARLQPYDSLTPQFRLHTASLSQTFHDRPPLFRATVETYRAQVDS